ncbi:xylose isomerase [Roseimicrobium sp. ORNL1]|uniref:xylose isomerase n=1 Tax=Roseimicrobium sp. ORNL1 TaxID=2711231 RepID=UPI0013E1E7D4|nr:xylose isomerase [Roseimicrobium sp. ORNL1]QIF03550.1 xylose isomerase [Roseimicrobium sp. ORNL1]
MSEAFPDIPKIPFEGPKSKNPLAFKHYNADEVVAGKTMRDHMRFGVAYWHAMRNTLSDPFGSGTSQKPWDDGTDSIENAKKRAHVCFEFMDKLGIDYYCFHDRDVAPEGKTLAESNKSLDAVADTLEELQKATGKKLLWGTACLFAHPRYNQGAATSPNANVYAYAGAQVKKALEVTHRLGGEGYTFWGGREGYSTLWNTNIKREMDHLAAFMHMAVDYKKKIGFKGPFYIEPKPREPSTHQYDSDSAACLNFLREYGLLEHFKLNIETNHATLAGHTMRHELEVALAAGALGSIDANTGDELIGWDTDQFPTDIYLTTQIMLVLLKMGGFTTGGLNFDAKCRRESFEPVDLFHAHIGGMDAFARGLKIASAIIEDGRLDAFVKQRYSTFDSGIGAKVEQGGCTLEDLEAYTLKNGEPVIGSGRQEMLENLVNEFI